MGLAPSQERKVNNIIERYNKRDQETERHRVKLLLLGTGESGKSTLLKQMKLLYGKKLRLTGADLPLNIKAIRTCLVGNLQELLTNVHVEDKSLEPIREEVLSWQFGLDSEDKDWGEKEVDKMQKLWHDSAVQEMWESGRAKLQVQDSLPHFMSRISKIFSPEYIPTDDDWLRVRVRTSGVVEEVFTLDGVEFMIVDVGGQRNERKKWLHCFSNVRAVIYVAALNEYDQVLFEDNNVNRMEEALELFENTVNDKNLSACGWILFLNKSDLYREKLGRSPIKYVDMKNPKKSRFVDYKGQDVRGLDPASEEFVDGYNDGIDYFAEKFRAKVHSPSTKDLYTHVTCAMDQHNVFVVFNACRGMILKEMMEAQGFIKNDL